MRNKTFWVTFLGVLAALGASEALAGGFVRPSTLTGSGAVYDPIVPPDGTQNITGGLTASGDVTVGSGNLIAGGANGVFLKYSGGTLGASVGGVAASGTSFNGQLNTSHIANGSGTPTSPTAGSGCGTSSAAGNSGGDLGGELHVTCGSAGTAGNAIVTITFAHAYNTAPFCTITPFDANTATVMVSAKIFPVTSTTTLNVTCGTGGTCPNTTVKWFYTCVQ